MEELTGILVVGDMVIKIRVPWAFLIFDAVGWAERMAHDAEEEVLHCVAEGDIESAETEAKLAKTLKKWLENPAQKIAYPNLAWTERIHSPLPLTATADNWESYVRCFMGLATEAGADEPVDFVCATDFLKPLLIGNERLRVALTNTGDWVMPVQLRGPNI